MMEIDPSNEEAFPGITAMKVELQVMYKIKDGAYFCYCAYVLHISRHLCFLWVVHTNTGIFLHSLKQSRESRT